MTHYSSLRNTVRRAAHKSIAFTPSLTLSEVVEQCCHQASRSTCDIARAVLRHAEMLAGRPVLVRECRYAFCRKLAEHMRRQGLADGTLRTYLERLGAMLRSVRGLDAPCLMPLLPPRCPSHKQVLTSAESHQLRSALNSDAACAAAGRAFFFSLQTALRFIDIAQLDWAHIHNYGEGYYLRKPIQKTGQVLEIGLNNTACALLQEQLGGCSLQQRPRAGRVFDGLPSYSTALRQLKHLAFVAGCEHFNLTFHVARHTFASELYRNSIPLATISKMLGHSSLAVTETYIHSFRQDEQRALALMNAF